MNDRRQMREGRREATEVKDPGGETVTLTVPSHPKYLYVVRSALYPIARSAGFSKQDTRKIVLAVDEACSNVIKHAYEGDHAKTIALTVTVNGGGIQIRIKDSGKKVDAAKIAPRRLEDIRPGGLGTHFMFTIFDTVEFDTSGERGTILTLVKKKKQ
ncbi:MAG TPA: ATP-binding protein [Nitrospirota bacterium]|nr:ATP-binding protein [Nitrospirota bacterium]